MNSKFVGRFRGPNPSDAAALPFEVQVTSALNRRGRKPTLLNRDGVDGKSYKLTVKIERLETRNGQAEDTDVVGPLSGSTALVMHVYVCPECTLLTSPMLACSFQIIAALTNSVVFDYQIYMPWYPSLGEFFSIALGGTPQGMKPLDWGLKRLDSDVFGFRGIFEVFAEGQPQSSVNHALHVSDIKWFRVKDDLNL